MNHRSVASRFPGLPHFLSKQLPILLLLLIISLGIYARLARSGDVSLCLDESWRIVCLLDAEHLFHQMFTGMNRTDPPLFNLMIYILGKLYNIEFVLRLASIVPGILAIPLAYLVGRHLFSNRWIALLGSFLTAFSLEIMVFSKELKPYSLCAFVHLGILYAYVRFRHRITVRSTIVFTALLVFSVPLSLHSAFAFPGIFLALFATTLFSGTRKQRNLVLFSCISLLLITSLCFFLLISNVDDEKQLTYMKDYWEDHFCPSGSVPGMIAWLSPRYLEHYTDVAFSNGLAPRFISRRLHLIYPLMALLGLLALLFRDRRRFLEAVLLFVAPLVVMALFSMQRQWPFGQLRMNIFVFFYVLFPPLYFLDELGRISSRIKENSRVRDVLSFVGGGGVVAVIVCLLIGIQFPLDFRTFAHSRAQGSWQASAPALEHLLDVYTEGPQIPLVCNHLGYSQLLYYSKYHRRTSVRYEKQARLFDPRSLLTRSNRFYMRGTLLRVCQESKQAAIYLAHYKPRETMLYDNEFSVEHDHMTGIGAASCLITSEIFEASLSKRMVLPEQRFTGSSDGWEQVYITPPLAVPDARAGSLVVFNLDLDFHSEDRKIRLAYLDQNGSAEHFDESSIEHNYPIDSDHLECATCFTLKEPVETVRLSISAKGGYDLTISTLEFFVANEKVWTAPEKPFRIVENICERIELLRGIRLVDGFWDDDIDGFGWTAGDATIGFDEMEIDGTRQVLKLETYGWMIPEFREDMMKSGLEIYLNGNQRIPLIQIDGEKDQRYFFHIPAEIRIVRSVRIRSNTFTPKELGLNNDGRALGIDVKSIGFPRIVDMEEKSPADCLSEKTLSVVLPAD